jgi:hypothetical protein
MIGAAFPAIVSPSFNSPRTDRARVQRDAAHMRPIFADHGAIRATI